MQLHPLCSQGQLQGARQIVTLAVTGWPSLPWPGPCQLDTGFLQSGPVTLAAPPNPPARSLPKATTCAAPLTLCPAGRAPRYSRALPAPGWLRENSVFASSLSLPEDQVPPLLPLQLRPPPPPPPSCMTQQNRSCCSKSKPSAQEAPQPGNGRGGGGKAGVQSRGSLGPTWHHTLLPYPGAREQNEVQADQAKPWRNAGACPQKG